MRTGTCFGLLAVVTLAAGGSAKPACAQSDCDGNACAPIAPHNGLCDWLDCDDDSLLCRDEPLLQCLRKQRLWGDWKYSVGGEFRYRYMDEQNRLRPAGTVRDTYNLWRIAPFLEVGNDQVTGYVQAIDASIFDNEIAEVPIDRNRADLLQYYLDFSLWDADDGQLRFRAGRQFLQYGSQHLVSPLGWANTYRNFEGFRLYCQSAGWDIDAFAVRPVNGAALASQYRPTSHDVPDASVWLTGVYASRKKVLGGAFDVYWMWNKEDEALLDRQDGNRHTFGARYWGTKPLPDLLPTASTWTWDAEGAWQTGDDNFLIAGPKRDVGAGFVSTIGALTLTDVPWTPALQGLFWWGSGDNTPGTGSISTVTTLYPFGHFYWGVLDNFNGSNLLDYSLQATIKPHRKLTLLAAWHWFDKANRNDAIYNIASVPQGGATTSRHIGQELDLIGTYAFNANLKVELGYSWFWYGQAVDQQPALVRDDAHQLYLMTTLGF
jgi:hypothetical protein